MLIRDGLVRLDMVHANTYLVKLNDGGNVLVDSGWPLSRYFLHRQLVDLGGAAYVVLTHYHIDHAGNAEYLRMRFGSRVVAHEDEAKVLEGKANPQVPKHWLGSLLFKYLPRLNVGRCLVDVKMRRWLELGDLVLIHTPGHTMGHIVAYSRRHGALFVGDLFRTTGNELHLGPSFFNYNEELIITSLWNIINANFDVNLILPGHGPPMRRSLEDIEELVRRLERGRAAKGTRGVETRPRRSRA